MTEGEIVRLVDCLTQGQRIRFLAGMYRCDQFWRYAMVSFEGEPARWPTARELSAACTVTQELALIAAGALTILGRVR